MNIEIGSKVKVSNHPIYGDFEGVLLGTPCLGGIQNYIIGVEEGDFKERALLIHGAWVTPIAGPKGEKYWLGKTLSYWSKDEDVISHWRSSESDVHIYYNKINNMYSTSVHFRGLVFSCERQVSEEKACEETERMLREVKDKIESFGI
jgi:hypothetical protein